MSKSMQEVAEELLVENAKIRLLLGRCQNHLEDGVEGDVLFREINNALARKGEYAPTKDPA